MCIFLRCVLLGKLLSVRISWRRGEQTQTELWWRTVCSLAFHKPHPPLYKSLEDDLDLLQNIVPHLLLPPTSFTIIVINNSSTWGWWTLQKCVDIRPYFSVAWAIWHVIWGSGSLQWDVQYVLQIFFTQLLAGPQAPAAHSIDSFTCISNFLCVKAQSIIGNLSTGH